MSIDSSGMVFCLRTISRICRSISARSIPVIIRAVKDARRRFYPALYPAWIVVCALLFLVLRDAPDPSRPSGRMTPAQARVTALEYLAKYDAARFGTYHVIDAAVYRDVQRDERVWVVICDSTPRSALKRAVIVDLEADTGEVVRTRRPAATPIEEFPIP